MPETAPPAPEPTALAALIGLAPWPDSSAIATGVWLASSVLFFLASWVLVRAAADGMDPFGASRLAWGGPLLLGIYVTHLGWLQVWHVASLQLGVPAYAWIAIGTVVVSCASVATTMLLRRFRWLRWTVV